MTPPPCPSEEGFYKKQGGATSWVTILSSVKDERGRETSVFVERAKEGDEGAISRTNKLDKVVWEHHHEALGMLIKGVYIKKEGKYGPQLCIRGKSKTIQVPFNSNHAKKFIACCRNLNLSELVGFEPYKMMRTNERGFPMKGEDGEVKYTTGWAIKQGGDKKENKVENDLDLSKDGPVPAARKLKNGKYDFSDAEEFLEEYLERWIEENNLDSRPEAEPQAEDEEEEPEEEEKKPVKKKKKKTYEEDESVPF
jgi:hypothetical protein